MFGDTQTQLTPSGLVEFTTKHPQYNLRDSLGSLDGEGDQLHSRSIVSSESPEARDSRHGAQCTVVGMHNDLQTMTSRSLQGGV